ncbi:MAG TPA: hypothetical protein VFL91_06645 [Thermomicrobiales bacterium]|nr:hypothetical protein [Thermomicrobiales bacterium]
MSNRLPLILELTKPVLLVGDEGPRSEFDPKAQLSSNTRSCQNTQSFNLAGLLSDIAADVAVDDVIA